MVRCSRCMTTRAAQSSFSVRLENNVAAITKQTKTAYAKTARARSAGSTMQTGMTPSAASGRQYPSDTVSGVLSITVASDAVVSATTAAYCDGAAPNASALSRPPQLPPRQT